MQTQQNIYNIRLILDNLRSVHNVGSIFRTSDAFGVERIYCAGTTPVPIDRFGRKRRDFTKVSLGAENTVVWEHTNDTLRPLQALKEAGWHIISLEQAENSISLTELTPFKRAVLIVGNEVDGVSQESLEFSDAVVEIPQIGEKESLNVSVATGIALFNMRLHQ